MSKTPSRRQNALDDISTNFNNLSISRTPSRIPTKPDVSNPFLAPSSRQISSQKSRDELKSEKRRKDLLASMDIVRCDIAGIKTEGKKDRKDYADRFIPARDGSLSKGPQLGSDMKKAVQDASPRTAQILAQACGIELNKRILSFHQPAPQPTTDPSLNEARKHAKPLYARPGSSLATSASTAAQVKGRKLPSTAERVLDAPGLMDDYYLNLLSWSAKNMLAVALSDTTYIWNAQTGTVDALGTVPEDTYIASLDWTADGSYLAVGLGTGEVELWDVSQQKRLRSMAGHQAQVGSLSWWDHIVSSGCADGSIFHHDVRVAQHKVSELLGHTAEVCGLKWREDGEMLASGGNDNVVNAWEGRTGGIGNDGNCLSVKPKWMKRNHTAAVKALAWCPWQPSLLATGGGTSDCTLHFWSAQTGARLHSLVTPSQITNVVWSPHTREFATTHGFPTNAIMVHQYPTLSQVHEVKNAHDARVLYAALSPDGTTLVSGAADENIKFWKLWEVPRKNKREERNSMGGIKMELIR
ncbi:cell division control protein [Calocera cornea HHB12733]|uniref:Cell division control protein n=1 Tax=Calocera cornea HHB12733 TaxID=1353952 RepID=A0A165HGN1_9BASI|nr:cell division control protein [Calocera cornea HHB12733]